MKITLSKNCNKTKLDSLVNYLEQFEIKIERSTRSDEILLEILGETSMIDTNIINELINVISIEVTPSPTLLSHRSYQNYDSKFNINDVSVGSGNFNVVASICNVQTDDDIIDLACKIKKSGASFLREQPLVHNSLTSPFRELKRESIRQMSIAKKACGLPIVCEITTIDQLDLFDHVDIIEVGSRNMQNFELLKQLSVCQKSILLTRGISNTIDEWLLSAEYILSGTNKNVILCDTGIRTFETSTKNTLDIASIAIIKQKSHLPVFIYPSCIVSSNNIALPVALAGIAAGADGVIVDVCNQTSTNAADCSSILTNDEFKRYMSVTTAQYGFTNNNKY